MHPHLDSMDSVNLAAVDEGAIAASQITNRGAILLDRDRAMLAADCVAIGAKIALFGSANKKSGTADSNLFA